MTAFDNLTAIPASFTAGEIVTWVETLAAYPGASYAVAYKFFGQTPLDGKQQFSITGAESGTAVYTFATSATVKPGIYRWEQRVTRQSDSVIRNICGGVVRVIPDLSAAQTITTAAAQVTLLEAVIAGFNATDKKSVNFNGQQFERADVTSYQKQLTYYRAAVIREQAAWNALFDGSQPANRIRQYFTE